MDGLVSLEIHTCMMIRQAFAFRDSNFPLPFSKKKKRLSKKLPCLTGCVIRKPTACRPFFINQFAGHYIITLLDSFNKKMKWTRVRSFATLNGAAGNLENSKTGPT